LSPKERKVQSSAPKQFRQVQVLKSSQPVSETVVEHERP
jgi:hypothetical protein